MQNEKLCRCGKPLHYTDSDLQQMVERLVVWKGEYINVTNIETNRTFRVPRHYIALHGLRGDELTSDNFEEV